MKAKIVLFFIAAAMVLPSITSLFDLDARRSRASVTISTTVVVAPIQDITSPN